MKKDKPRIHLDEYIYKLSRKNTEINIKKITILFKDANKMQIIKNIIFL